MWDWNVAMRDTNANDFANSNCTNVGLKYAPWPDARTVTFSILIAPMWDWNCNTESAVGSRLHILIAPMWDWNFDRAENENRYGAILIAPMWDWNGIRLYCFIFVLCYSNCTNVGLKLGKVDGLWWRVRYSNCTNVGLKYWNRSHRRRSKPIF